MKRGITCHRQGPRRSFFSDALPLLRRVPASVSAPGPAWAAMAFAMHAAVRAA